MGFGVFLGIAVKGYENSGTEEMVSYGDAGKYSLNYAFFPVYPVLMRIFSAPLKAFGLNPVSSAALAGVVLSLIGAFFAMLSLFYITKEHLGEEGGLRTAFYMLVFPTAFLFAQIYTEGLFVGLAFSSLALMRYKKLMWAAMIAAVAVLTKAVGIFLVIPLIIAVIREMDLKNIKERGFPLRKLLLSGYILIPVAAFVLWRVSYAGHVFEIVDREYFTRGFLKISESFIMWKSALKTIFSSNLQGRVYYLMELGAIGLSIFSCIATFKRYPAISAFGLIVIIVSLTSITPFGMARYILPVPSIYILLATWGKDKVFDKAWTMSSLLLFGMGATLFTFDRWVG